MNWKVLCWIKHKPAQITRERWDKGDFNGYWGCLDTMMVMGCERCGEWLSTKGSFTVEETSYD